LWFDFGTAPTTRPAQATRTRRDRRLFQPLFNNIENALYDLVLNETDRLIKIVFCILLVLWVGLIFLMIFARPSSSSDLPSNDVAFSEKSLVYAEAAQ